MTSAVRIKALLEASPETRRYMLAGLASLSLNALLILWLTHSVDSHPPRIAPPIEPITVDIIEETAPEPAPVVESEQPPQPIFEVQPETAPVEEAPLAPAPPEARPDEASSGRAAAIVEAPPPREEPAPEELEKDKRGGATDVPPEWTVDRTGTTLEDFAGAPLFPAPQSGAGDEGEADRLRRILNAAACADLQLSLRAGANCPPVGAYLRYGAVGEADRLAQVDQKRLQLMFPEGFLDQSKPTLPDGALPQPAGENLAARKQGASNGMVGTLPEAYTHPYSQ